MCSEQGYELAYKLASERLASIDIRQQCLKSGAQYVAPNRVIIDYLSQSYVITLPDIVISLRDSEEEIPLRDKILMLHYLTSAKGTSISDRLITFRQLLGGASYLSPFSQRTITPLLHRFDKEPELLIDAAEKLGGCRADYGDVSVCIKAFPRIPLTIVLWQGDSEFAPRGNMMFDSTISDYLSIEDIYVLCENIVMKLVNLSKGRS